MTLDEIVLKGIHAPDYAVVYIVRDGPEFLYIGKSNNVERRLAQHLGYDPLPSTGFFDEGVQENLPHCRTWQMEFVEIPEEILNTGNQAQVDRWISNEEFRLI